MVAHAPSISRQRQPQWRVQGSLGETRRADQCWRGQAPAPTLGTCLLHLSGGSRALRRPRGTRGPAVRAMRRRLRDAGRRSRERHAVAREKSSYEHQKDWYSANRDKLRAEYAADGRVPDSESVTIVLRKDIAPRFVQGPFSEAEDRVIIAWRDADLMLAVALGRTYDAVIGRKHRLRRAGRLWA